MPDPLQVSENGAAGSSPAPGFCKTSTGAALGSSPAPAKRLLLPRDQHSPRRLPPRAPRRAQPLRRAAGATGSPVQPGSIQKTRDTASSRMNGHIHRPLASPASTAPAPATIPAPCPTARRSPRSPASAARTLAPLLQSPSHPGAHPQPLVTATPPPRWGSGTAARGACSRAASQARACSHRPAWVLGEPRTRVCARTSSLTQPSLIGSQEHNFSSNYIFSTSEKMRFW